MHHGFLNIDITWEAVSVGTEAAEWYLEYLKKIID